MKQYVILVAGYDYANSGVDFCNMASNRKNFLLRQNPSWRDDPEVVFVRFDTKSGKIERNLSSDRNSWTLESNNFTPIRRSTHYQNNQFVNSENSVLSIEDCYAYVARIGASEPGTIKECSVLGHGWFDGPILVNSFQRSEYNTGANSGLRDPWDKDGRAKDFQSSNMDEAEWANFRNAFMSDGYCWIWGCLFPRAYYNTLYYVIRSAAYRSKSLGSHTDTDTFTITVSQDFANSHFTSDPQFFPATTSERTFIRSLRDLKMFVKRGIIRCYPGRFAGDNGITCRAAYLGVYSDYERAGRGISSSETTMIIPRNRTTYGIDFSDIINFYKTYVGCEEEPENRGYAVYTNAQIRNWWTEVYGS